MLRFMILLLLLGLSVRAAFPEEPEEPPDDEKCELEYYEKIDSSIQTLIAESHYQQQDLLTIKDDLGALKFGLAYVQHTTFEINEFVDKIERFLKRLRRFLRRLFFSPFATLLESAETVNAATDAAQLQLQTTVSEQGAALMDADTELEALKQAVLMFMNSVQTSFSALETSQTTYQNSVIATLENLQMSVDNLLLDLGEEEEEEEEET